ncbi:cytokinin riboside 5'-monophosphate phosphoribohydrolase [Marinicauda pacifica]|uniref:Cytokinin riboside 5'-monophosphate phosphoribohydrolase n=1 Tax=Marinicauda pacifica TaxID=1133559 RepID=A0A4S2HE78_9PROT|nr:MULTISPECIES: TIGR00730 family Rossman fold protein [Marinicauda]TGY94173.1 TIGR00730 family Rossman fold protein [Marinicauda pacifica]GGE33538.1 cytokinin riboside 5'-monophosphate phosphoribohydrolase [Marinicauda pacifica]
MAKLRSVCVYCGTRTGNEPAFEALAEEAGRRVAQAGYRLVFGGGTAGLAGIAARAAADAGGTVLGVIPEFLIPVEGAFEGIELRKVATLGARKSMMIAESDGFLALPGGTGTLEEVFDLLTRRNLGLENKPVAFVDNQFWGPFSTLLDHVVRYEFTDPALVDGLSFEPDIQSALAALRIGEPG